MFLPIGDDVEKRHLPFVTIGLVIVNLFVFIHECNVLHEQEEEFVKAWFSVWGLVPKELGAGYFVGLFTHMFLHGDLMHLVGNMVVLWAFAYSLEAGLGSVGFIIAYLAWGLVGGLAHALVSWGGDIPLVGASGAIAGAIGAYTIYFGYNTRIRCLFFLFYRPFTVYIPAAVFGGIWILLQLFQATADEGGLSGIAWFAHIGGFAAGMVWMLVARNYTESVLVETRGGELEFRTRDELARLDEDGEELVDVNAAEETPQPQLEACPYCGTQIDDGLRIGESLARCQNPSCDRMIALDYDLEPSRG